MDFNNKKVLVLGGVAPHCKIVKAAKEMGVFTIVADYLEDSPAKRIADKSYLINIMDVDAIVDLCRREQVDGVISCYNDPAQHVYADICNRLNLPCYATKEELDILSNKRLFKDLCIASNVDVILEYSDEDIKNNSIEYPVFVKPVDSRGSRGQYVCYNEEELRFALPQARQQSSNGEVIVEKYMKDVDEIQVTYFFVNGNPYLIRTADSYCGSEKNHLNKVVACGISPSKNTDKYLMLAHEKVVMMLKKLGVQNGPVFMQGFVDGNAFRFFDPGRRFPGVDFELIFQQVFHLDIMKEMVSFSLTGKTNSIYLPDDGYLLNGKIAAILFPTVKAGIIHHIEGIDKIQSENGIISVQLKYKDGDKVEWEYSVNQRLAEIDMVAGDIKELKKLINTVQTSICAFDAFGQKMNFELFNTERIKVLSL